jgi:hypothetical protein
MYSLINLDLQNFIKSNSVCSSLFWINVGICICIEYGLFRFLYFNFEFMYSLINLDLQNFIKSNGVCSSLFWINVGISRPSRRTW